MSLCTECKSITTRTFGQDRTLLFRHKHDSLRKAVFESKCHICYHVWESLSDEQKAIASRPEFMGIEYYISIRTLDFQERDPSDCLAEISFEWFDDFFDCDDYNEVGGLHVDFSGVFAALNPVGMSFRFPSFFPLRGRDGFLVL
jgi:hypothetical protein